MCNCNNGEYGRIWRQYDNENQITSGMKTERIYEDKSNISLSVMWLWEANTILKTDYLNEYQEKKTMKRRRPRRWKRRTHRTVCGGCDERQTERVRRAHSETTTSRRRGKRACDACAWQSTRHVMCERPNMHTSRKTIWGKSNINMGEWHQWREREMERYECIYAIQYSGERREEWH